MTTDSAIAIGIFSVFLTLAVIIPFVNQGFEQSTSTIDTDGFTSDMGQEIEDANVINAPITALTIFISIFKMFFWSFGTFHWVIELILSIFRITLIWLVVRIIRGVG